MKNSKYILHLLACVVFLALLPALTLVMSDIHPENVHLFDGFSDLPDVSRVVSMLFLLTLREPVLFHRGGKTTFRFQDKSERIIFISFRFDNILAFCEGDPVCNKQLVHSFIGSFDSNVKQFRICLQEKNEEAAVELSHRMLTLCRYLEASEISDIIAPLARRNSAFRGSGSFYLQGEQALEMIEALLNVIRENELMMYSAGEGR